jgi:hypothetical protein
MKKPSRGKLVSCGAAVELSKTVGALILWRPGGHVNWLNAEQDVAEYLSAEA